MATRKRVFRGDRLRAIREKMDISQDDMADRLGFGQSQMNKYENGKADPSAEVVARMARELGVTADWLLDLVDEPTSYYQEPDITVQERKLLSAYRRQDWRGLFGLLSNNTPKEE